MVGASFAAIPLYRMFCSVTGFAGTTQVVAHRAQARARPRADRPLRFQRRARPAVEIRAGAERDQAAHRRSGDRPLQGHQRSRAHHRRAGLVQCHADHGRRLFRQDQLLLLHRADHEAGRDARDDGGVLRRSQDRRRPRPGPAQHHHAVLHLLPAARHRRGRWPRRRTRHRASFNGDKGRRRRRTKRSQRRRRWPRLTQSITTTTWSIRARGRSSAPSRRS